MVGRYRQEKKKYWLGMFRKLKAFYDHHGHANVPDRYKADEVLGRWVSTGSLYEKPGAVEGKASEDGELQVQRRHPRRPFEEQAEGFQKAGSFYKKHGHANVPEGYHEPRLSIFVGYLRQYPERHRRR